MMRTSLRPFVFVAAAMACADIAAADSTSPQEGAGAPRLTLERLVAPASRVVVQGRQVRFALHALIRFDTLQELFAYIDAEAGRWQFTTAAERDAFADGLMRRGVESRIVSMETELPLEVILTHTRDELGRAVAGIVTADGPLVFKGRNWRLTKDAYRRALLRVRDRWSVSLNCWSASSSIPGRVLSNWYIVRRGYRAVRRQVRFDGALLAGGQVPPGCDVRRAAVAACVRDGDRLASLGRDSPG